MIATSRSAGIRTTSPSPAVLQFRWHAAGLAAMILFGCTQIGMAASRSAEIGTAPRARALCSEIVGVQPGDRHFHDCVASLADSLESARIDHTIMQARGKCFAQGLLPETSELSLCLLRAANVSAPAEMTERIERLDADIDPRPPQSDSPDSLLGREQQACARTGFDPAFGAFASCVADLQSALQNTDMPAN